MDSDEIITLSDDDDDDDDYYRPPPRTVPPPPPQTAPTHVEKSAPKPASTHKTVMYDRPCPKSKKKIYCGQVRTETRDLGDGACTRPTAAAVAAKPFTGAFVAAPASTTATVAKTATVATTAKTAAAKYPPPLPKVPRHATRRPSWKDVPPAPSLRCVAASADGSAELRWSMDGAGGQPRRWADVKAYEVYVCHETDAPPDAAMWRMMDLIRAPLPPGCVLVDCPPGVHHVAVRAVDVHDRRAPFARKTFTVGRP